MARWSAVLRRGFHVSREYGIDVLDVLFVRDVMKEQAVVLQAEAPAPQALALVNRPLDDRSQHLFSVLDEAGLLMGAATFTELSAWGSDPALADRALGSLTKATLLTISSSETLRSAVHRMAEAGVTLLLVVNPADPRHLVGKLALHDLLEARARHLEEERRRERVLPWEYLLPPRLRPRDAGRPTPEGRPEAPVEAEH